MSSTPYDRQTSFALFSAENPTSQQSGADLDAEFNAVKLALDDTQQNLAKIQDDDGALKRGSVGQAQLDSSVSLGFGAPTQWASGVLYTADVSTVFFNSIFYIANTTHTSGASFDASKFGLLADFTTSAVIPDGSITSAKLADGAIASTKIADGSVTTSKVASNAVTTTKIADAAIVMSKMSGALLTGLRDLILPAGLGPLPWSSSTVAPAGWVLCYGQQVFRSQYPALWAHAQTEMAAGNTLFGVGDGSTTFTVPDMRGRVPAGKDNLGGTQAGRLYFGPSDVDGLTMGANGGTQNATLVVSQLPAHTHVNTLNDPGHTHSYTRLNGSVHQDGTVSATVQTANITDTTGSSTTGVTITNASIGSGNGHTNVQPTLVTSYIIKAH